ncbi:MAG: hypothetical protein K1X64_22935 [Myxococcaceae bacterium]|nr:hypothetical protein [Myxococcaceae bacterium]
MERSANEQVTWCCGIAILAGLAACGPLTAGQTNNNEDSLPDGGASTSACVKDADCKEFACGDGSFRHETCVSGQCTASTTGCPPAECSKDSDCKEFVCGDDSFRHETCVSGQCMAPTTGCPPAECSKDSDCKEFVCGDGRFSHEVCVSSQCVASTLSCQ